MSVLEILGNSHDGHYLCIRLDDIELTVTVPDLAVARRSINRGYNASLRGYRVDESQVTTLINAMNAPQFLWPPITCRYCDTDASYLIHGHPHCRTCARLFAPQEGVR